ncbi:Hsp70 family protein [Butyrivibrio sp. AC2005]|uniref:Hsp70 family protein n=1 Tax=Butyrivibrio sp. AC2005 TaxID=1280672 RepID=UPI000420A140|nr:Hsp70 family protein [Butyrivibrio sp. AC2005]
MTLGIDLSSDIISYSFFQNNAIKTYYIKESIGFRTNNVFNNKSTLLPLIKGIKNTAEKMLNSTVDKAVYSVPEYCTNFQYGLLRDVSILTGIAPLRIMNSNSSIALSICEEICFDPLTYNNDCFINLVCSIYSNYAELSAFIYIDNVLEMLGTTTILINSIISEKDEIKLKDRIGSELHQFDNDLNIHKMIDSRSFLFLNNSGGNDAISKLFTAAFQTIFCIKRLNISSSASKGAIIRANHVEGIIAATLIMSTQNKAISACLGENGEHKKLVDYYTHLPTKRADCLLVSTEPELFIYEGNYINRKYDTIIGEFSIPENFEGHQIWVTVDIDIDMRIKVSVSDDSQNIIIPYTLL